MSKSHRKKNYYKKLSEKLKRIIDLEIVQYIKSGITPSFSKIYKHLANNKNRPRFDEVLEDFENYLTSFVIEGDSSAKEFAISLTNLAGTPVEVEYKHLLKTLKNIRIQREKVLYADNSQQQNFQYWDRAKGFSEHVAKSTWNFAKGITSTIVSSLKNPFSGAKTLGILIMYTLANNPIAGYRLVQKRSSSYLEQIEILDKSDWYTLYDVCNEIIGEFDRERELQLDKKTQGNFFEFLKYAFAGGAENSLLEQDKEKLFKLTQHLLDKSYNYNISDSDDLELLYNLFNVYLRLHFYRYANLILVDVSRYAKYIVDSGESIQDEDKRQVAEFFWVLQANLKQYGKKIEPDSFIYVLDNIKLLNCDIYHWDGDSIFSFRIALIVMWGLREHYKDNIRICNLLDEHASELVGHILRAAQTKHYLMSEEEIKESVYIEYVRKLPETEEKTALFSGKYKIVHRDQVFPNSFFHTINGTPIKIKIFLQQPLLEEENHILIETIKNTYARVEKFKQAVNSIESSVVLEATTFNLYIFKDNEAYQRYGSLWNINTGGGGYAQVRVPEIEERLYDYGEHKSEKWYEGFVYRQPKGDGRDGENKEGRGFRNLGHEIQHKFFYALVGHAELDNLPSWLVEGSANALGNEACFNEEADYIKQHKKKLPSMKKINAMTYASGADHYYFGSALFRFMLEQDPYFLGKIINSAKAGEKAESIMTLIKAWIAVENREAHFSDWLKKIINTCYLANRTTLHDLVSALQTNASGARALLQKIDFTQENIHAPLNKNGDRIIHYVVRAKNWDVLWSLLKKGVSLETRNNQGVTAYAMAEEHSYNRVKLAQLKKWGRDAKAQLAKHFTDSTLVLPLVTSTTVSDNENTFSKLPSTRINFSTPKAVTDNPGRDRGKEIVVRTTLFDLLSALQTNASDARALAEKIDFKRVNIHVPLNVNGDRIIHYAVRAKNFGVLRELLSKGASLETRNNQGVTAYAMAEDSYSQEELGQLKYWGREAKAVLAKHFTDSTLVPPLVTSTTVSDNENTFSKLPSTRINFSTPKAVTDNPGRDRGKKVIVRTTSQSELEKLKYWDRGAKARLAKYFTDSTLVPPAATNTTVSGVAIGTAVINLLTTSTTPTHVSAAEEQVPWWTAGTGIAAVLGVAGVAFWAGYRCKKRKNNSKPNNSKPLGLHEQSLAMLPVVSTESDSVSVSTYSDFSDFSDFTSTSSNASEIAANHIVPVSRGLVCREETLSSDTTEMTYLIDLAEERNYLIDILEKRLAFLKPLVCYWRFEDDIKRLRVPIGQEDGEGLSVLANIQSILEDKEIEKKIKKYAKGRSEIESAKVIIESLAQRFRLLTLAYRQPVISYLTDPLKNGLLIMINSAQGQSELLRDELENLSGESKNLISILYKYLIALETVLYDAMFLAHSPVYNEASSADAKPIAYYEAYQFSTIRNALIPSRDKESNKELEVILDSRSDKECLKKHLRLDLPPQLEIILNVLANLLPKAAEIKNIKVRKTLVSNIQLMVVSISEIKNKLEADIQYNKGSERLQSDVAASQLDERLNSRPAQGMSAR